MSFSTETTAKLRWPIIHTQLGVPSEHALDLEMHARWGRVVASRMRKWKHRRRRRSGEKKAKARAKEALAIKANEKDELTNFVNQISDVATAWSEDVVNHPSEKGKVRLQDCPGQWYVIHLKNMITARVTRGKCTGLGYSDQDSRRLSHLWHFYLLWSASAQPSRHR